MVCWWQGKLVDYYMWRVVVYWSVDDGIRIDTGTIFQLGEQKLYDFSVCEAKICEEQARQSNSKYNFMQYVFFKKGIHSVQWVWGKAPEAGGIFENFCVKSNLTVYKVTFNCKLQKKLGDQDVQVAPPITLLGDQLLPLLPRFPCLCGICIQPLK